MTTRPDIHAKAETLIEALPYFQRYAGRSFVVKYGGNAMGDERAAREFAEDVVLLRAVGINPVVVHGGGPQIGAMLEKLGVETTFVDGLRVTDKQTAEVRARSTRRSSARSPAPGARRSASRARMAGSSPRPSCSARARTPTAISRKRSTWASSANPRRSTPRSSKPPPARG